jgi:hypothetical protein
MRQFDFFGTWFDSWTIVEAVLRLGQVEIIPDLWYEHPNCVRISTLTERWKQLLQSRRRFFIVREGMPLRANGFVKQITGNRAGQYRIDLVSLALGVECTLPACYEEDGRVMLGSGSIYLADEFWLEPSEQIAVPPDDDTIMLYKQVVECVKQNCVQQRLIRFKGWIGKDGAKLLNAGQAIVKDRGS